MPLLSDLAGPSQHFKAAILDAWRNKAAADLCGGEGFRGGPLLDVHGSLQLLNSSHVRERDKALLRSIMVGGVWNGFEDHTAKKKGAGGNQIWTNGRGHLSGCTTGSSRIQFRHFLIASFRR